MDVEWTSEKPKVAGLYWRRADKLNSSYLVLVFQGPIGLVARIVEEPVEWRASWCQNNPIDSAIETFTGGTWAGPLGAADEVRV
jgi:hypothetical protein